MHNRGRQYGWHTAVIIVGTMAIAAVVSSTVLLTIYAQSQKDSAEGLTVSLSRKSTMDPSSSPSKITLRLTFDNGAAFTVTQFEGLPIRVERNGSSFGIATHVDTSNGNQIKADMFRGVPMNSADVSIKDRRPDVSLFDIGREPSELPFSEFGVKVELVGISYGANARIEHHDTSRIHLMMAPGGSECCLTCGTITVCGCAVEGPCGSCCSGQCCT